jgi:hypothetical protein
MRRRSAAMDEQFLAEGARSRESNERWLQKMEALDRAVDALPDIYKVPVLLHYQRGLSYDEVAAVVGCAPGTVASRLATAREKMKESLSAMGALAILPGWEALLAKLPDAEPPAGYLEDLNMLIRNAGPGSAGMGWMAVAGASVVAVAISGAVAFWAPSPKETARTASLEFIQNPPMPPGGTSTTPARAPIPGDAASRPSGAGDRKGNAVPSQEYKITIRGTVTMADTGTPSGGSVFLAKVWPPDPMEQRKGSRSPYDVDLAADGSFAVERSLSGPAILRLSAFPTKSRQTAYAAPVFVVDGPRDEKVNIMIRPAPTVADVRRIESPSQRLLLEALAAAFVRDKVSFISGSIQRETGGELPESLYVRIIDHEGDAIWSDPRIDYETGRFVMGPMAPGTYKLEAAAGPEGFGAATSVTVEDGRETAHVTITMRQGDAQIAGVVVDAAGKPMAGAHLEVFPESMSDSGLWMPPAAVVDTGADGTFELGRLGPLQELYRIRITRESYQPTSRTGVAAGERNMRVVLKPKPKIRGRIVMKSTGKPSKSIRVVVSEASEKLRYKGSVQTMEMSADYDPATGAFTDEVEHAGKVNIRIDRQWNTIKTVNDVDVPDEGLDVGVIEVDDSK